MIKKFIFYASLIVFAAIVWYVVNPKEKLDPINRFQIKQVTYKFISKTSSSITPIDINNSLRIDTQTGKTWHLIGFDKDTIWIPISEYSKKNLPKKFHKGKLNPFEGIIDK